VPTEETPPEADDQSRDAPTTPDADAGKVTPAGSEPPRPQTPPAPDSGDAPTEQQPPAGQSPRKEFTGDLPIKERPHRVLVAVLLTLATILAVVGSLAVWVNRQIFNTENWANTSSQLLAAPQVQQAVGKILVNDAFKAVPLEEEFEKALPGPAKFLAGPATSGLHQLAEKIAPNILATSQVQEVWREANIAAQKQLVKILEGGSTAVSTKNGEVVLHLQPIVEEIARQVAGPEAAKKVGELFKNGSAETGLGLAQSKLKELGVKTPSSVKVQNEGNILLLHSDQLSAAQDVAKTLKGLSVILPVLALILFAAAIALAAGWRRVALRTSGWCFAIAALAIFVIRKVGGEQIVNSAVKVPSNKPAVHEAWEIVTGQLHDVAVALLIYAAALIIAAWLAGPTRPAKAIRRTVAPTLREFPGRAYAAGLVLLPLIIAWGPTAATHEVIPVIGFAILIALGIAMLSRQTAVEFPDTKLGETTEALKAKWRELRSH